MRFTIVFGLIITSLIGYSQKTERVSGSYSMVIESYMSDDQAEAIALEQARLQAMADNFGTKISQSTRTRMETANGMTDTRFSSIANSFVNGIWIEDSREPVYTKQDRGDERWITCEIVGQARRVVKAAPEFIAKPIKCLDINCATQEFKDGERIFFYFKSPVDGFLSIYFDLPNENISQMLLPYPSMKGNTLKIEADKEYFLFRIDPKYNYTDLSVVEEYYLYTNDPVQETDLIYVIFSTEDYFKPSMDIDQKEFVTETGTDASEFTGFPKSGESKKFRKWLNKNVSINENMFLEVIDITISKE